MQAYLAVLSGARAGRSASYRKDSITIGRHPDNDLQLDPRADLEVSARHLVLEFGPPGWVARDLGSRNGTYINGVRVLGQFPVRSGDRIRMGTNGPLIEFRSGPGAAVEETHAPFAAPSAAPPTAAPERPLPAAPRRAARHRTAVLAGVGVLLLAAAAIVLGLRQERRWTSERVVLEQRMDSTRRADERTIAALLQERDRLAGALDRAYADLRHSGGRLAQLGGRAEAGAAPPASAGSPAPITPDPIDYRAIERANRPAVALVYVEYEDGEVTAGTAFAVRSDATLLTNQHLITGADGGRRPQRIAVQFSDSDQVWPARLLGISASADLAAVKVDNIIGGVPTIRRFNTRADTLRAGAPVAVLGFPSSHENGERYPRPLLSAGAVLGLNAAVLEVRGSGEVGASGSPVFDSRGEVVAVLFGGRRAEGRAATLLTVPAAAALEFLGSLPASRAPAP